MKTLACVTAALGVLGTIVAANPASAAMGQCFDAYGRPLGPPHSTDNPPYGLICQAYRRGGRCTHVQYSWAIGHCGLSRRYGYHDDDYRPRYRSRQYDDDHDYRPRYRSRQYDYGPHYDRGATPQERELRRLQRSDPNMQYQRHPDPTHPPIPDRGPPNSAR